MPNFYTTVIQADPRFTSTADCRDIALLEPNFRAAVQSVIADAAAQGITLQVTETFRSAARQQMLFAQGATQLDGQTPATIGVHHFGLAVDLVRVQNGKADWATADYTFLQALAEKYGLTWGGDWGIPAKLHQPGFHDWDHLQGCTVAQQDALFAGDWYPDDSPAVAT
jgi:peptidoglycan L-alanyl-D-glutamate endopeptidase CwlK